MATMDLQTAQDMVDHYVATRKTLIDDTYGINDTIGVWFSKAQLQNFVDSLSDDATGVRIYLAAYEDDQAVYPDQTTIIAIETVGDQLGNHIDRIGQARRGLGYTGAGSDPYNHGVLCPPNNDCA